MTLGKRVRHRRKQLRMSQQKLAENRWTRSYISQVELGKAVPSLETLTTIANRLDCTLGELMGDTQILQAAKSTLFTPEACLKYLDMLPKTDTTIVLSQLAHALQDNRSPQCQLPADPELFYLTARVHIYQRNYQDALSILTQGLRYANELWKLRLLALLRETAAQIDDVERYRYANEQIAKALSDTASIDELYQRLYRTTLAPGGAELSSDVMEAIRGLEWCKDLAKLFSNSDS